MAQDPNVSVWRSAISINWVCWNCPIEFCRWDACMKSHAFKKVSVTQQAPKSHLLNWNCFNMAGRMELGSEYTESFEPVTCQSQYCASETNLPWRFRQKLPHQNTPQHPVLLKANKSTWWEWGKALNIRLPSALLLSKGAKPWLGLTPSAKRRTSLDINRLQLIAWSWTFTASSFEWSGSPNGRPSAHSDPNFRRAADHGSFPSAHGSSRKDILVESMPGTSCACDLHGFVEALECVERILSRKKAVTERDAGR